MNRVLEAPTFPGLPKLSKILDTIGELGVFNPHDGAGWELRKLRWYRDALFEHYAPYRVGDRLVMHTACPADGAWAGYREMMQPGATAAVTEVDWKARELRDEDAEPGDGYWAIAVMFDHEWVVSHWGHERRVFERDPDDRHVFWFGQPERYWRGEHAGLEAAA